MSSNTSPPLPTSAPSPIPPPPSRLPQPTGNFLRDSIESAKHITDVPCARNSLLSGIASGVGIGVIRGLSAGSLVAGHWAIATFTVISLGSWHLCQKKMADERRQITQVIESMPKRALKKEDEGASETSS